MQNFNQAEIGQIPIDSSGRAARGFLDRVDRKFYCDATGLADTLSDAPCVFNVGAIAG